MQLSKNASASSSQSGFLKSYIQLSRLEISPLARNNALSHATGDFIVFIDDDEFPAAWLAVESVSDV